MGTSTSGCGTKNGSKELEAFGSPIQCVDPGELLQAMKGDLLLQKTRGSLSLCFSGKGVWVPNTNWPREVTMASVQEGTSPF